MSVLKKVSLGNNKLGISPKAVCPCSTYCSGSPTTTPGIWERQDQVNASVQASVNRTVSQMSLGPDNK